MTKLLLKLFIKDYQNISDSKVRGKYGILSEIKRPEYINQCI